MDRGGGRAEGDRTARRPAGRRPPRDEPRDARSSLERFKANSPETWFVLKMSAAALLVALFHPVLSWLAVPLLIVTTLLTPVVLFGWSAATGRRVLDIARDHLTLFPVMVDAKPGQKEDFTPWATYGVIAFNGLVFLAQNHPQVPASFIGDNLLFVPRNPTPWNMVPGLFASIALHADFWHLFWNMAFFWPVAVEVERRTGSRALLVAYVLSGLAGNVVQAGVYQFSLGRVARGLGSSGAVYGIMGVYAVRCYNRTMVFPVPLIGPLVYLRLELNAILVLCFYFLQSYQQGMRILAGGTSRIGHWAHFGGMCTGILVALGRRLGEDAVREKRLTLGERAAAGGLESLDDGEGEEALRAVLAREPGNLDALVHMAHLTSNLGHVRPAAEEPEQPTPDRMPFRVARASLTAKLVPTREGERWYREALRRLPAKDPRAASLFREFVTIYRGVLEPGLHYRLAGSLAQAGDRETASRALELLLEHPELAPAHREQALVQQMRLLADLGYGEAMRGAAQQLLEDFPESRHAASAREHLGGA